MNKLEVYIRPLQRDDALVSCKWRNDPEIWKFTGHRPDRYITPEIELNWIDKVLKDDTCRRFAICLQKDDLYIGNVQLTNIDQDSAIFHIFIGEKQFWGQGVASMATKLIIDYAKNQLKLKNIKLMVNPQNIAAQKVYRKNGFIPIDEKITMIIEFNN